MSKRKNRKNSSQNYKARRTGKTIGIIAAIILGATILTSAVGFMSDGFMNSNPLEWMEKEVNKDNLIKKENYLIKDGEDGGKGIELHMDEYGVIKANGKATSDNTFTIAELVLQPGQYTLSGVKSGDGYGLRAVGATVDAKAGVSNATFTVETAQTVSIQLYVAEDQRLIYKTFEPCLVPGDSAGDFFE